MNLKFILLRKYSNFIKHLIFSLLFFVLPVKALTQKQNENYKNLVEQCSIDTLEQNLIKLEQLGVKEARTPALKQTKTWLINHYQNYGYNDIKTDDFPFQNDTVSNLIVTKQGTQYPDSFLVICGHYDTRKGPGIGDNGSGTAIMLEIARLIKNVETEFSVMFVHFTCEEDGLIGSKHFVNQVLDPDKKIKLVLNIDAVGGVSSKKNDKIVCESDQDSPSENDNQSKFYTNQLAQFVEMYSNLQPRFDKAYASDYMPFQNKGYIITGLYEFNRSPFAHTADDTFKNVDIQYIYQVAKAALGAALNFAN